MAWHEGLPVRRLVLDAGAAVFRQGDPVREIFRVQAGQVRLLRHLPHGGRVSLYTSRAGEGLAEAALFSKRYHCDAIALTPARIDAYPAAAIRAQLETYPDRAIDLAAQFARQVRELRTQLELRDTKSATGRLLAWIALNADREGALHPDQSWSDIAEQIGLTREAVYRALASLTRQGLIERTPGQVRLL